MGKKGESKSKSKDSKQQDSAAAKEAEALAEEVKNFSFFRQYIFSSRLDKLYMVIGSIAAFASGGAMPLSALFFGDIPNKLGSNNGPDAAFEAASQFGLEFLYIGIGAWVTSYLGFASWSIVGERQGIEIRRRYFKSLLQQEIAFYDSINPNELSTKITEECHNIQEGIGEKVYTFINSMSMLLAGLIIGFIKGWQLTLVLLGFFPVMGIVGAVLGLSMQKLTKVNNEAFAEAGAISEESLNGIRTVVSLGGQDKEIKRYEAVMGKNSGPIIKYSTLTGVSLGVLFLAMFAVYALGFFVGAKFIEHGVYNPTDNGPYTVGSVLTVFFAILMASFTPTRAAPCSKAFAVAKASAVKAFKIIERKSEISINDEKGLRPTSVEGSIKFDNVVFSYPLKKDRTILNGITFTIRPNEKTAFVGESGCGKTTCMQLIERFYDISEGNGSITLDGNELKGLNLKWMRENIGYVGQEPVLFATSIKENLLMAKDDATDAEIWNALKQANAADFVNNLPDKLNTFVGTNGAMLSGGQKQRLAIARAILKNPKILLLDEATSALDRKNEREIQKTLDEISQGRTTIVIAHRLSTIINADHIIVFDQGVVVEEGRHEELVAKQGKYYALQHLQLQSEERDNANQPAESPELNVNKNKDSNKSSVVGDDKAITNKGEVNLNVKSNEKDKDNTKGKKSKKDPNRPSDMKLFYRLLTFSRGDIHLVVIGSIGALVLGCVQPFVAPILANMLDVLGQPNAPDFSSRSGLFAGLFLVLAVVAGVSFSVQLSCLGVVAERLSRKVRSEVFRKYLKMPIGWFDDPLHSAGALNSKLSTEANLINNITGNVIGSYLQAASAITTGMIIAFVACWKLALIGIALTPLMVISGNIRSKFYLTARASSDDAYQESIAFVSEAVNNMRTVASFGKEYKLLENYSNKLALPLKNSMKNAHVSGFVLGIGEFINFGVYALAFYLAAVFMKVDGLTFLNMFMAVMAIMMGAMGAGNAMQFAPDVGSALNAAVSVFKVLDTVPAIDIDDPKQTVKTPIQGNIEFKNVWFKYPSREKQIFKGLNLKINSSEKTAFVGPSGCGKSTILALIQRFYDIDQGEILIDGVNIRNYDLRHLRESYGVVSQEPVLFNGTIEYNIKYSKENATDEEMKTAATKACAIGFIENNEFDVMGDQQEANQKYGTGFHRKVGPKGSQMSGGQKQRIAIARAILKNPSFLILDEATSALDAQNEKTVQEALDQIMEGKTSVIVAHRITTIKDADRIVVINDGEIIEEGNYQQLTEMRGMFYKLERGMNLADQI